MAEIYKSQVQANATYTHKFNVDKLQNYIGEGLRNVSVAMSDVSDLAADIEDRKAADLMTVAATEASTLLEDWLDFTGEDYELRMKDAAMQKFDDAFNSLSPDTQRRMEMKNPKLREIYGLKVDEAVAKKSLQHQFDTLKSFIPSDASSIVQGHTPDEIKQAFLLKQEQIRTNPVIAKHPEYGEQLLAELGKQVFEGAVSMAIFDERFEDAASIVMDEELSKYIEPSQKAMYLSRIKSGMSSLYSSKSKSETKNSELASNFLVSVFDNWSASLRGVVTPDDITDTWTSMVGQLADGVPVDELNLGGITGFVFSDEIKDTIGKLSRSEMMAAVDKAKKAVLDNNYGYKETIARRFNDAQTKMQQIRDHIDGLEDSDPIPVEKLTPKDYSDLSMVVSDLRKYRVALSSEQMKDLYEMERLLDNKERLIRFSVDLGVNGVNAMTEAAGGGKEYVRTGQFTPAEAINLMTKGAEGPQSSLDVLLQNNELKDTGAMLYKMGILRQNPEQDEYKQWLYETSEKMLESKAKAEAKKSTSGIKSLVKNTGNSEIDELWTGKKTVENKEQTPAEKAFEARVQRYISGIEPMEPGGYSPEKRLLADELVRDYARAFGETEMPARGTYRYASYLLPSALLYFDQSDLPDDKRLFGVGGGRFTSYNAMDLTQQIQSAYNIRLDDVIDEDRKTSVEDSNTYKLVLDALDSIGVEYDQQAAKDLASFIRQSEDHWYTFSAGLKKPKGAYKERLESASADTKIKF